MGEQITNARLNELILDAIQGLQLDIVTLEERSVDAADADRDYRQVKATAYLKTKGTVSEREALVESATRDPRHRAKLADDMKVAALEAVRCRRATLSALQTLANSVKTEWDATREQ